MEHDAQSVDAAVRRALTPALERWFAQWREWHVIPEYLFHYTTPTGLLGILKSQTLWASDAACLNDATELAYSSEVISSVLAFDYWRKYDSELIRRFLEEASTYLMPNLQSNPYTTIHVVCFSENGDLLSQWRGYGGPAGGCAICFNAQFFCASPESRVALRKVVYDRQHQESIVGDLIERVLDYLESIESSGPKDVAEAHATHSLRLIREEFMECLFCFKHPEFSEENEWRAVYFRPDSPERWPIDLLPLQFRSVGRLVVPYVELSLPDPAGDFAGRLPIQGIVCGPSDRPELAAKTARMLLDTYDYRSALSGVWNSKVPLRS